MITVQSLTSTDHTVPSGGVASPQSLAERLLRSHPAIGRSRHLAGSRIFAEDETLDCLYVVVRGWALKSKWLIEGRRQILDFAMPGDVLGSISAQRMSHGAEMLTDGEVVVVRRGLFQTVAGANPEIAIAVCRQREAAEQRAYERIASIGCRSARLRVCRLLVELAERPFEPGGATHALKLPLPLRQIHIADALGIRIETVCRVLGQLSRSGIACLKSGWLTVADLDALRAEAEREDSPPAAALSPWIAHDHGRDPHAQPASGPARRGRPGSDAAGSGMDLGEEGLSEPR